MRSQVPFTLVCVSCVLIVVRSLHSHTSFPSHTFLWFLCDLLWAPLAISLPCPLPMLNSISSPWMTRQPLEPAWDTFFCSVKVSATLENIAFLTVALDPPIVTSLLFCSDADLVLNCYSTSLLTGWLCSNDWPNRSCLVIPFSFFADCSRGVGTFPFT